MHLMQTLMPWPEFSCWPTYWNSMRRLWWFCCFNFFSLVLQIPVICIYGTTDSTQCWMAPALTGQFSSSFIQALHAAWLRCNPECLVCRHWQHTRHSGLQRSHAAYSAWACSSWGTASCNILCIKTKHHCCSAPDSLMPGSSTNFSALQPAKGLLYMGSLMLGWSAETLRSWLFSCYQNYSNSI